MEGKKTKTPIEANVDPVLPQDLIPNILVHLPVKSIGRLRCVSKSWRSILTNPGFIKDHINIHMNDPEEFIFTIGSSDSTSRYIETTSQYTLIFTPISNYDAISSKVNCALEEKSLFWVCNACHGLVLLNDQRLDCFKLLMNPITLEVMEVPHGPSSLFNSSALGYDSSSDDYKIVTLGSVNKCVDVYTLKAKTWRRIGEFSYRLPSYFYGVVSAPGVFCNGSLSWIAFDEKTVNNDHPVILAFDLTKEVLEEVPFPSLVGYNNLDALDLRCLDRCLALVHSSSLRGSIDVWIMKENGVRGSWTKLITINCSEYRDRQCKFIVVCLLGEDEIVLESYRPFAKLVAYSWRNGVWRDLVVTGDFSYPYNYVLSPFRESLMSPRTGN